mgnify:CR=1 FL=1
MAKESASPQKGWTFEAAAMPVTAYMAAIIKAGVLLAADGHHGAVPHGDVVDRGERHQPRPDVAHQGSAAAGAVEGVKATVDVAESVGYSATTR